MASNKTLMERRKKKPRAPKAVRPSEEAERYYRGQLRGLVRMMASELVAALEPELKRLKPDYIADSLVTMDGWAEQILSAIRRVSSRFTSALFEPQIARVAASTVSRAEADNAEDFRDSINKAVGVDFQLITKPKGMTDYLEASTAENVNLIKSIPAEYFHKVETLVLGGMKDGLAPTAIAKQIQAETGVSARRASLIARDQVSQLNSDLTRQRQTAAGIEFYKAVTLVMCAYLGTLLGSTRTPRSAAGALPGKTSATARASTRCPKARHGAARSDCTQASITFSAAASGSP